jgi:hypothetical protein
MRNYMRRTEHVKRDEALSRLHEEDKKRQSKAFKNFDKWRRYKGFKESLEKTYESNRKRALNMATGLTVQKRQLEALDPVVVSTQFGTTPENLLKVITIPYLNSVGADIFEEITLETMNDSIYYLDYMYGSTKRGATEGEKMMDKSEAFYPAETDVQSVTASATLTNYTGTLSNPSVVPYKVFVNIAGVGTYASDNGQEVISGSYTPVGGGTTVTITGTIDYVTGDYDITFDTAPGAGVTVDIEYNYNSEDPDNYDEQGNVNLLLTRINFDPRPYQLGVSWSIMSQLKLDSTLGVDSEDILYKGAGYELTKSSDVRFLRAGYKIAKKKSPVIFDSDWATAGADSSIDYARTFFAKAIRPAGSKTYSATNRGQKPTAIYGGYAAIDYLTQIPEFKMDESSYAQGCYKVGSLFGIDIYQAPSGTGADSLKRDRVLPENELVTVFKNQAVPMDVPLVKGVFVPLASTEMLEYKNLYRERAFYQVNDTQTLQDNYIQRIQITNLTY